MTDAAPDVSKKANVYIWFYFIVLGLALFLMIGILDIYFRFQVEYEQSLKIGQIESAEVISYKASNKAFMSGKNGLFPGKKFVDIDTAIRRFIHDLI